MEILFNKTRIIWLILTETRLWWNFKNIFIIKVSSYIKLSIKTIKTKYDFV